MKEENNVCLSKLESDSTYLSKPKTVKTRKTQETYIEEVSKIHPEYDFSNTIYKGSKRKLKVECPKHGEFERLAQSILRGCKCPYCNREEAGRRYSKSLDTFLNEVKLIHPEYDFSKVEYVNTKTKVEVICNIHGSFHTTPSHLLIGCKCIKCANIENGVNHQMSKEEYLERVYKKLKEVNSTLKIYEDTYVDRKSKITIESETHGVLEVETLSLIQNKVGCPKCGKVVGGEKQRVSYETFLKKAIKKFKGKFTYFEDTYKGSSTKMQALCPQHGEITIIPYFHIRQKYGCNQCMVDDNGGYAPYYDKPTTLYYIKLIKGNEEYFKLGITTTTLDKRFITLRSEGLTYEILLTKTFPTGISAYYLEQHLLHKYSSNKIDFILLPKSGGNSEIFNQDIYESIKQYFD